MVILGDQVHQVHQEHPDKHGQGERGDQLVVAVERVPYRGVDKFDNHFNRVDEAAGYAGLGFFRNPAEQPAEQDAEADGPGHGIEVDGGEAHR